MFLNRLVLALFIAALSTTLTFAANPQSTAPSEEQIINDTDQDITIEDEDLAD